MKERSDSRERDDLDRVFRIMELFIANAKTYTQLSSGGLILTVTFAREVLGMADTEPIPWDWSLVATWVFLLVAALSGVTYQYLAVRFLELKTRVPIHHRFDWPHALRRNPWIAYALMMLSFYLGAAFFTATAIRGLSGG